MLADFIYRTSCRDDSPGTSRRLQPPCEALNAHGSPGSLDIDQLTPCCEQLVGLD